MLRPKAIEVAVKDDYCLLITFDNQEKKIFDVKPYLSFKPFEELKNPALFKTVKPAGLSIALSETEVPAGAYDQHGCRIFFMSDLSQAMEIFLFLLSSGISFHKIRK